MKTKRELDKESLGRDCLYVNQRISEEQSTLSGYQHALCQIVSQELPFISNRHRLNALVKQSPFKL
jgi:hypothetical protein